jgi:hypothetical protein
MTSDRAAPLAVLYFTSYTLGSVSFG